MADGATLEEGTRAGFVATMAPYFRPRPLAALLLGISSGFPLALLLGTMTFWLAKVGIDKKTIGFAIGLTTPYTLKFLWAPLVDRLKLPVLTGLFGQRRAWLFFVQALLFASVWMLGASQPELHLGVFAFWAIATAFLGATQDIIIDAYRIEILPEDELAHGTANNQFGYRLGAFAAGVGTIAMASPEGLGLGWAKAYGLTGLCILPGLLAALWAGPGLHDRVLSAEGRQSIGQWLQSTLIGPFSEFLMRRGAVLILLFVLVYKLGDAMGQSMLNPMIVELGFSDTEFIAINKVIGFWGLIVGTALSAPLLAWLGMGRALFVSGVLMMISNLTFAILASQGHSTLWLTIAVATEQVTSGLGLTIFVTYLSGLSSLAYTATQFALLSSLAGVGRTWLSTPAGFFAEQLGWAGFWVMTTVVALPGMLLLWILWRKGFVVESVRKARAGAEPTAGAEAKA
ncbi:PAT family beta-lactamase induction signal transducer AmpG [Sphingomonas naasensis]|uniref:MFS transporter n=1 Tax=Sphingomonas naasensis TaxID=1344951 RepID=A0A4S1WVN3_9SPHN|nr:AmpG family muropeptide MFS transporter [Sphingomonas naasensis]NIJ18367.1 PAT family beta-lactamase induction signal transducer AmpG [Sphingomonas naasensis]TGX45636.1 MFS transporter [Sphingomonas naasensis]